jgi:hypothetical protein
MQIRFSVVWGIAGGVWLISATLIDDTDAHKDYDSTGRLVDFLIASVCLDLILAGSEIYHHLRLIFFKNTVDEGIEAGADGAELGEMRPNTVQGQGYQPQQLQVPMQTAAGQGKTFLLNTYFEQCL